MKTPRPAGSSPRRDDRVLELFAPATRAWFRASFPCPTPVQTRGWPSIAGGAHSLLLAPTGSGKTLAAFLSAIDRVGRLSVEERERAPGVRVLYISPLKALAYDVERNLRVPLGGIARVAAELAAEGPGAPFHEARISLRTGDTSPKDRALLRRSPGEILITTPESLYLLLGSAARESLRTVETVIVDEIHALAPTKRGMHLALSLERLEELVGRAPQRIGLSATQRPLDEIARFLAGSRPVEIIDASERPALDLVIEVPVDEMERPTPKTELSQHVVGTRAGSGRARGAGMNEAHLRPADPPREVDPPDGGIFNAIHPRLLELIHAHRSTIVFTNSRRLCERLAQRLNELDGSSLVRAHHGSIAREKREEIEAMLKDGRLRGLVATSSLELGIDMGAVDLVIQIESPGSVSRGLQRVGRAGHQVGARSQGRIFPKHRGDLLEAAVVAHRMLAADVEPIVVPRNALDVLAQQIVAMASVEVLSVARLEQTVRRAYSFRDLSHELLVSVLDMLAGHHPTEGAAAAAFADLRPRIVWDRTDDTIHARRDARIIALVNGGTIPDRGLYGVHLGEGGPRIGELDEEMVHESRVGQTFLLGASSWRIAEITRDRVIVQPAPGEPGRMPFWRGEGPGRPIDLGRALGAFVRVLDEKPEAEALAWLGAEYLLDARAARNLYRYVGDQRRATGTVPSDRAITIERFRDELGDFRVCILSPFGARVHAPWALALEARLGAMLGFEVQSLSSDDGIALRFADTDEIPGADVLVPRPDEIKELILGELGRSALFASHFRECAARALLLPRRWPGRRTPLWSQRLRAQNLLAVASQYPRFPIVLETYRECLDDVFDVPALVELLAAIERREVRVVEVETRSASPFARSLAFAWVAAFLYQGDAPLAERKAQALTLDRNLLSELLGHEELRDLLEPEVLSEVEAELQGIDEERRIRHADALHDLLRRIGDLSEVEIAARAHGDPAGWTDELARSGRAFPILVAGEPRWVAVEDVARYRDALDAAVPSGVPPVFLGLAQAALPGLVARYARSHGPFTAHDVALRFGRNDAAIEPVLSSLVAAGQLRAGGFRHGAITPEHCDVDVLRRLRRRTLARLRNEVAPVEGTALARFLSSWHGVGVKRGGLPRLREVVAQLEGLPLPFSELERSILPARVSDYQPRMLDELGALGELVWVGHSLLHGDDGRVALYRRDRAPQLIAAPVSGSSEPGSSGAPGDAPPFGAIHRALLNHLASHGASFFFQLSGAAGDPRTDELLAAIWDLVWAGLVTNDTFAPLRALAAPRASLRGRARAHVVEAGGRWSRVADLLATPGAEARPSDTQIAHARALMLLERYGVVSREAVASESLAGGFAPLSSVLRAMEEAGKVRRGHFVEGLSGAQYAHAAAVDRLREVRESQAEAIVRLSLVDPANPWGALLAWPDTAGEGDLRPRRVTGSEVVLVRGQPVLLIEGGGHRLRIFRSAFSDGTVVPRALGSLRPASGSSGARRELRIERIDGVPALESPHVRLFERAGFRVEPGRLVLSPSD